MKLPNVPSWNFAFLNHEHFRREQEDQVEVGKELMRQEFTEWLNQVLASLVTETYSVLTLQVEMVAVESGMPDVHFGKIREFHRCEACSFSSSQ